MKKNTFDTMAKTLLLLILLESQFSIFAQNKPMPKAKTDSFWEHVQFGGGFGLNIGNGYTDVTVAPSAIYNFNDYFSLGSGLQYSHIKQKDYYSSNIIGGSLIGLFNPIEEVQVSLEVEEIHVDNNYGTVHESIKKSFWNTGLYIGAGFRNENITIGGRVNVLFDKNKDLYDSAYMPFIRVYF